MGGPVPSLGGGWLGDAPPRPSRLNGWKEIASHFGKGVRTVQRWESESGLPVHRLGSSRSEAVYAFVEELERWRLTSEAKRVEARAAGAPNENGNGDAEPDQSGQRAPVSPAPGPAASRSVRRGAGAALAVVALALAGAAGTWFVLRSIESGADPSPRAGHASPSSAAQPASARVERGVLNAYGEDERLLWSRSFDFRATDSAYRPAALAGQEPVVVHDIDGDGPAEVLFVSEPTLTTSRGLFCFNHDGSLRFHHQPSDTVAFGPLTAAPPWRAFWMRVFGEPGRPHSVWLVSSHLSEFPTVVEKLDPRGRVLGRYWSNGQVVELAEAEIGGRRLVFIGATSNEFKGGVLAVLDGASPTGTAPAADPHYRCAGCPPAAPLHYLVFPRLEAAVAASTYSSVSDIRVDDLGQVLLQVHHGAEPFVSYEQSLATSLSSYVLDADLHIVKAELGDKYEVVHRMLEGRGLITHPFSKEAEERSLWPVLRWEYGGFVEVTRPDHAPQARPGGAARR